MDEAAQLARSGDTAAAIARYQQWIRQDSSSLRKVALFNLAVLQSDAQALEDARQSYEAALALDAFFHQARLNLGSLLERMGRPDEALAAWRVTAESPTDGPAFLAGESAEPDNWPLRALNQIGRLLEQEKRFAEAEQVLLRSLQRDPRQIDVLQHYQHLRQKQLQWPITEPVPGVTMNDMLMAMSPLSMLAYSNDPALLLLAARNFVARKLQPAPAPLPPAPSWLHARLRIGYLSGDLCTHAVGLLLAEAMHAHDRSRVETFAFDYGPEDGTAHRRRLLAGFEHVHAVQSHSDEALAALIRSQEIDVLVDLHGLSQGLRAGVLARRPAPVQVTYLGFIGSTAMPWIDYVVGDAYALPPELAPYFSEKFLHLNSCFIPADRSRYAGIPALSRQSQGLPEDAVVFGAFNNSYKITRAMTDIWFDILNEVPASVLWLVDDNPEATASLRRYAAARGLAPERLVFSPRVATEPYLGRLRMMDLFLDCFPYNAGSTARDVLQMSTPLLTLSGRSFVSRMAGSLLRQLGLDELVTDSAAAYKASAVAWGLDAAARAALRGRVAQAVAAAPAAEQFTRALEAALQRAHSGQVPSLFAGDLDELARVTAGAAGRTGLAAGQGVGPGAAQRSPSLFNVSYQAAAGATPAGEVPRVLPYMVGYSEATYAAIEAPFLPLDHRQNERSDWQEYWPIRRFLLQEKLDDSAYYGFFSPRFTEKTGLNGHALLRYMEQVPGSVDVVLFSPQADMGAFFLSVFEQNEVFDPGFSAAAQQLCDSVGLAVNINTLMMDSRTVVFSNYFLARPVFWRRWLAVCERLFEVCEQQPALAQASGFVAPTTYRGGLQRKVFLMERVASLLLATEPRWRTQAYNPFKCAFSASKLGLAPADAVLSDALKIASDIQKYPEYMNQFSLIRNKFKA